MQNTSKILRFQNYGMRSAGETKCKFPNLKITFAMRGKPCFTWRKHAHRICHYDSSCVTYTERDRMFSTNQNYPRFGKRKRLQRALIRAASDRDPSPFPLPLPLAYCDKLYIQARHMIAFTTNFCQCILIVFVQFLCSKETKACETLPK